MTRDAIQPFIDMQQPVTLTIKKTRLFSAHITVTLDHFDGRCVVATNGHYYRMSYIKGIVRADAPNGVAT